VISGDAFELRLRLLMKYNQEDPHPRPDIFVPAQHWMLEKRQSPHDTAAHTTHSAGLISTDLPLSISVPLRYVRFFGGPTLLCTHSLQHLCLLRRMRGDGIETAFSLVEGVCLPTFAPELLVATADENEKARGPLIGRKLRARGTRTTTTQFRPRRASAPIIRYLSAFRAGRHVAQRSSLTNFVLK
jgi:hypothetical protein